LQMTADVDHRKYGKECWRKSPFAWKAASNLREVKPLPSIERMWLQVIRRMWAGDVHLRSCEHFKKISPKARS
jgi:hypothetical protein